MRLPGRSRQEHAFELGDHLGESVDALESLLAQRPCSLQVDQEACERARAHRLHGAARFRQRLTDVQDQASENFVSEQDASFYAELYKKAGIKGGHVILLNGHDSPYYESTKEQAILALHTYPGGLQIGGGVNPENAGEYLSAGASHVIVTSYVFKDGRISWENLNKMKETVGKEKLVLDLSCRRKDGKYYIVTDRWQKFTDVTMTLDIMKELGSYCDEFLVHAVDVEGKARGVETELASLLGEYKGNSVTYAGGVGSMKDIEDLRKYGKDRLDVTVGSALDLFGGNISFSELIKL